MNMKYIIVFLLIIFGYSSLAAKTPKKFTDSIVLKNGTVLNGIRVTNTITVKTEDGGTIIYKKKDISEIRKDSFVKENESSKMQSKEGSEVAKKERSSINVLWGDYQGVMQWEDAMAVCSKLGMRLPTISELREAYINGVTETWKKDGFFYWSSTPSESDHSFNIGIGNGHLFVDDRSFVNDVRCVR